MNMSVSLDQLDDFHRFAQQKLLAEVPNRWKSFAICGGSNIPATKKRPRSMRSSNKAWPISKPAAIVPLHEVMAELRAKYGLPPS